jgi:hypothetical protein
VKVKNPKAPAVKREAEEDWGAVKQKGRDLRGLFSFEETRERPSYRPLNTKSDY